MTRSSTGRRDRESVFRRWTRLLREKSTTPKHVSTHPNTTMETSHPEERPLKKRRFFAEDPSPVHVSPIRPASPQPSVGSVVSPLDIPDRDRGIQDGGDMGGFDVGTLQAVVGELPAPTLQKLKAVSGSNVQRGRRYAFERGPLLM